MRGYREFAWMVAGLIAAGPCVYSSMADVAGEPERVRQLEDRVAELENLVSQLSAQTGEGWLTESRANEIRSMVADVLADADTRASLLEGGQVAGWDKGFKIGSPDGNFMLQIGGYMQVRFGYNHRDNSSDDDRWGFDLRRAKITLKGHVIDPSWTYSIQGAFGRDTRPYLTGVAVDFDEEDVTTSSSSISGPMELDDAYIQKNLGGGWYVRFGQFKLPFLHEELVSSTRQIGLERSLINAAFTLNRSQGVRVQYDADNYRVYGAYSDGAGLKNTSFLTYDTEYAFTGRGEWLVAGDWKQFDDLTSWRGEEFGLLVGGAIHYQRGEFGTAATETDTLSWTLDASAEFGGFGLFAAIVGRHLDFNSAGMADLDQIGFVIEGSVFLADDLDLYGRFEWGDDDIAGNDELAIVTVGVNKYFNKHQLKWSTDIGLAFDEVEATWASSSAGWQTDTDGADNQIVVRSQFQLLF